MPDGSILLYYLMSYQTTGDPAATQPGNLWKIGVAQSTDNGRSFTHRGVAYTGTSSTADPFPLMLDTRGTLRLFFGPQGGVRSVTATDATGLTFPSTPDPGLRVSTSGAVPGALKIGSTYYLYVNGANYYTSPDGLTFSLGGLTTLSLNAPSPIDAGGGTYLMAYVCAGGSDAAAHVTCMASSADGRTWTNIGQVGAGSVPGLVKDSSGTLRIYVPNQ